MTFEPAPGGLLRLRNLGAHTAVVLRASITDEDGIERPLDVPYPEESAMGQLTPTEDKPWCEGQLLAPNWDYYVQTFGIERI